MKTARKIYAGIAASLLLVATACTNDLTDEPTTSAAAGDTMLKLELTLDGTRSYTDKTSFSEGDEILVIAYNLNKGKQASSKATFTNNQWVLETGIDLNTLEIAEGNSLRIYAYYPYSAVAQYADERTWASIKLPDVLNQIDYIGGEYDDVTLDNPVAKITMTHAMSKLTLLFNNPTESSINLNSIKLSTYSSNEETYSWIYKEAQFLASPYYSYIYPQNDTVQPATFELNEKYSIPAGQTQKVEFLIPPSSGIHYKWGQIEGHNEDTGVLFQFVVDGKSYQFKVATPSWSNGENYTYNVTPQIQPEEKIEYSYIDLGLSVLWATSNIGAAEPTEIGKFFFWGDTKGYIPGQEYTKEAFSFIFPKTDEELLEDNIIELAPNADESEYKYRLTSKFDAATCNMGEPWRMPTADEMAEMVENTNFECVKIDDKWMFKFTSKISGYEDRFIILPCPWGSFQTTSSSFTFHSISVSNYPSGEWWCSSVPYDYANRGMLMEIVNNQYANPWTWIRSLNRNLGYNIRAVRPVNVTEKKDGFATR